jgi:hypothetical protein
MANQNQNQNQNQNPGHQGNQGQKTPNQGQQGQGMRSCRRPFRREAERRYLSA